MKINIITYVFFFCMMVTHHANTQTLDRSNWTLSGSSNVSALSNAIDASLSTRWDTRQAQMPGQFFTIDLGSLPTFSKIELNTSDSPNDYPREYSVYVSNNGRNWGDSIASGIGGGSITNIYLGETTARHIRIEQTGSDSYYWWSIHDVQVKNESVTSVELDRSAWVLSASSNAADLTNAIDDSPDTRWTTYRQVQTPGQYFQIDFGAREQFDKIVIDPTTSIHDYPRGYSVYASRDGVTWNRLIATGVGSTDGPTYIEFEQQSARYLRIEQTGSSDRYWWSIGEINVFVSVVPTPSPTPTIVPSPQPSPSPTPGPFTEIFGADSFIRIAENESGFDRELDPGDRFGRDHDRAGDINGDGIVDLVVGARSDDDGATDAGAVYILFLNADGSVNSHQKISALEGGFNDSLSAGDFFGYGVAGIGDYDNDGVPDIAASSLGDANTALYIIHLNRNGSVKSMIKNVGITAQGLSAADLNQDGKADLIAANPTASRNVGEISLLFFDSNSEVIREEVVTIGGNTPGLSDQINVGDSFGGRESALLGDIDADGTIEIAVGSFLAENNRGAIWVISLESETYRVVDQLKIAPGLAGFDEVFPNDTGNFGHALVAAGDLNGDGVPDIISGANLINEGVGYILYLNADKSVKTFTRITETEGGFDLLLGDGDRFSRSMSIVDDRRDEGSITVNMGGGVSAGGAGAIYTLTFEACSILQQEGNTFWTGGATLFTNWNHNTQTVTGPLSYEQCMLKAFENDAPNITAQESDGRCIIKDSDAQLVFSEEGSTSYIRSCP